MFQKNVKYFLLRLTLLFRTSEYNPRRDKQGKDGQKTDKDKEAFAQPLQKFEESAAEETI